MSDGAHPTTEALTPADLAPLFEDPPEALRARLQWPHSPFAFWLARTRPAWRIAGHGAAFNEACAVIVAANRSYEPISPPASAADLLVLDAPGHDDEMGFEQWLPLLAPGALVLIHGIHAGCGNSHLWQQWQRERPASPVFTLAAGQGLGLVMIDEALAPPVIRALFALLPNDAAAFEQACRSAAARWEAASREVETRRSVDWLARSHVRATQRQKEGLHEAIREIAAERALLSAERARMEHLEHRVAAMEASNTWRAGMALQRIPAPVRTVLRRSAQVIWWVLTGQLVRRLRARRASRRAAAEPASKPASAVSVMPPPPPADEPTSRTPMPAVRLPEERDACLAVPFGYAPTPLSTPPRVAAMVHLFYDDLAAETLDVLRNIPGPLDLLITTDTGAKRQAIESVFSGWRNGSVEVHLVPNRGADIAPRFVTLRDAHAPYDLVLYLHGKKSLHWARGTDWRTYLYHSLAGSGDVVRSIFAAFAASPTLGLVLPQHWGPIRRSIDWGYSFADARNLAARMDIDLRPNDPLDFPSGSMFWARPAALRPLLDLGLTEMDFPPADTGDVTYAHAIERLLLRICERTGHTWIKIADPALIDERSRLYCVHSPEELSRLLLELPVSLSDPALQSDRAGARA